ncbi:MAG TPA: outer membrane protein assembly factor BamC [Casimicrobiaceae bacterium]
MPTDLRRRAAAIFGAAALAALLAGCESMSTSLGKKIDYKSTSSAPALEIPPDLTTPAYDDRYSASTASAAAAARAAGKPSEVLPTNAEARLVRSGSERWLVVKTTPEAAWSTLRDFWSQNGFVVALEQPALGIMETDWAENRAAAPQTGLAKYVGKYLEFLTDTYRRDKFRTRIERGTQPGTVEIYISHKGAAQLPTKTKGGSPEDWVWQPTPPDPELEAEFLSRLMIKFGTPQQAAESAVATLSTQSPRARIEKGPDGATRLVVDDAFDRAWRRVGLALDRTGFTVVDRDRSKGLYFVRYANPDIDVKRKGWLDKLKFWQVNEKDKPEQYRVVVTQADPNSVVTVQDPNGTADKSANGDKILALLQDQLK